MQAEQGYERLGLVLQAALDQAQYGKGKERHANGKPFENQPILVIARMLDSVDGPLQQAIKKAVESKTILKIRGPQAAFDEILGAINYLAAGAIMYQQQIALPRKAPAIRGSARRHHDISVDKGQRGGATP